MPLLWSGVLIRQVESDTTAGWSEIARFVAQACHSLLDWTTLMFFLASVSDKGVCTLAEQRGEKVKLQSGLRKTQEARMNTRVCKHSSKKKNKRARVYVIDMNVIR